MLRGLLRRPRQIIWATVNPNIPIAWDADNILVCERKKVGRHMRIVASGAIDRPKVRSYSLDILEGGEQALRKRSTQYGIRVSHEHSRAPTASARALALLLCA